MNKKLPFMVMGLFVIELLWVAVPTVSAGAIVQVTRTPVPTLTPITTPVPFDPEQYITPVVTTCPYGTPVGWGTVTPDPQWYVMCEACIPVTSTATLPSIPTVLPTICSTSIPDGTSTPSSSCVTATPGPTYTPVVTSTSTAVPTATPSGYAFEVVNAYTYLRNTPYADTDISSFSCTPAVGSMGVYTVTCSGTLSANDNSPFIGGGVAFDLAVTAVNYPNNWYYYASITNSSNASVAEYRTGSASGPLVSPGGGSYTNGASPDGGFTLAIFASDGYTGGFSADFTVTLSTSPLPSVTPTPTMAVTPTLAPSFCQSVVSVGNVPEPFEFGGGDIVYQECGIIPPVDVGVLLLYLEGLGGIFSPFDFIVELVTFLFPDIASWNFEGMNICLRARDYSLYMFGIQMPIDEFVALGIIIGALNMVNPVLAGLVNMGRTPDTGSGVGSDVGTFTGTTTTTDKDGNTKTSVWTKHNGGSK